MYKLYCRHPSLNALLFLPHGHKYEYIVGVCELLNCLILFFILGYRARGAHPNHDRGHSNHDPGDSEEQELQAAIQQSLNEGDTRTHDRTQQHSSNHNEDRDLQRAIERSLAESDDTNPPPNLDSIQQSPPYNPDFLPNDVHDTTTPLNSSEHHINSGADLQSSETVLPDTRTRNDQMSSLRRRPVAHSNVENTSSSIHDTRTAAQPPRDNIDAVRAARLRKFGINN